MCMRYVNANAVMFKSITRDTNDTISFENPFEKLRASRDDTGVLNITNMNVVTYITLMGSKNKDVDNVLNKRETLQVVVRLTKCSLDRDEKLSLDLDNFEIVTKDSPNIVQGACVEYLNFKRISPIGKIRLDIDNPTGEYAVKVLVRKKDDKLYTVQSIQHLIIE